VRFEVTATAPFRAEACNCSICAMSGFLHWIVSRGQFSLLSGAGQLSHYHFNTGIADHQFCSHCGIKSFYVPRSHPSAVSVNVRCLDQLGLDDFEIRAFDGQHWEQAVASIR